MISALMDSDSQWLLGASRGACEGSNMSMNIGSFVTRTLDGQYLISHKSA